MQEILLMQAVLEDEFVGAQRPVEKNDLRTSSLVFLTAVVDEESSLWPTARDQRSNFAGRRFPKLSANNCGFLSPKG